MKVVTKYLLCALVSIGLACATYAKPHDGKDENDKGKPDKLEAVYGIHKKDKETKVPIVCKPAKDPSERPFSVPDAGSRAALLGLSLGVVGLARRKWASRQLKT